MLAQASSEIVFADGFSPSVPSNGINESSLSSTKSLFVGDLSFFCTEVDLGPLFAKFGNLASLEVKRGRHGDSLMHGFVEYELESSAQVAIAELNNRKFMGRCMRVNCTNMKAMPVKNLENLVQVHVNFLTPELSKKVTEEYIESAFIQYGQIGDVVVKRHLCSYQPPQVTGYAFVYFFDTYAALRAVHGLKGVNIDGVIFECCLSYKAEQSLREQTGMEAVLKSVQPPQPGSFFKRFGTQQSSPSGSVGSLPSPQAVYANSPGQGYRPYRGRGSPAGHNETYAHQSSVHPRVGHSNGQTRHLSVPLVPYRSINNTGYDRPPVSNTDGFPPRAAYPPGGRHNGPSPRSVAGYVQQQPFYQQQQKFSASPYHHTQGMSPQAGNGHRFFSLQPQSDVYHSKLPNTVSFPPAPRMTTPTSAMGYGGLPSPGAATFIHEGLMDDWSSASQSPSARSRFGSSAYSQDDFGVIGIASTRSSQSSESLRFTVNSMSLESMSVNETSFSSDPKFVGFQSFPTDVLSDINYGLLFDHSLLQDNEPQQQQMHQVVAPQSGPIVNDF